MYRFLRVFIISSVFLYAQERSIVEVNAIDVNSSGDIIEAHNGIEVIYQDTLIRANSAVFNKKTNILKVKGHVEIIGYNSTKELADEVDIDINSSKVEFKKLFMATENDIWISTLKAKQADGVYTTGASILSSCEVSNPLWKMAFDKSKYYKDDKYIKLYDTTMYFMDVPVFYSPYLAFSTNKERSSGFLFPLFGYSDDEGFIYEQPIFWAIAPNMDMEFNPQIRTDRSFGGYSTFRFVDSAHSKGGLRVGYFKDKSSYALLHPNDEDSHYGAEFRYDSSLLFSQYLSGYQDGLYINAIYLNDIDYLNLQKTSFGDFGESSLQESKLNYYLQNNDFYMGINAKYFIDTRTNVNQDEILQILPSINLHKYLSEFLFKNLTYSVDMHFDNYYRKEGVNLKQLELSVPIDYTFFLFDDYLGISLSEDLYYTKLFFDKGEFEYDQFRYSSSLHKIKIYSDLTKKYDTFTHVMQPSLEYIKPGFESQHPVSVDEFNENQQELFDVGLPRENFKLSFNQYFYTSDMKLKFYQHLSQIYYSEKTTLKPYKLGDLYNEMEYNIGKWKLYNEMIFSHHYSKIRESSSFIKYNNSTYSLAFRHTYRDILGDEDGIKLDKANEVGMSFRYTYNQHWSYNGALTYNIDESSSKQWKLGAKYKQDCWDVSFSIRQEIIPRPTGSDTLNSFYIMMNFVPFASVGAKL